MTRARAQACPNAGVRLGPTFVSGVLPVLLDWGWAVADHTRVLRRVRFPQESVTRAMVQALSTTKGALSITLYAILGGAFAGFAQVFPLWIKSSAGFGLNARCVPRRAMPAWGWRVFGTAVLENPNCLEKDSP